MRKSAFSEYSSAEDQHSAQELKRLHDFPQEQDGENNSRHRFEISKDSHCLHGELSDGGEVKITAQSGVK